MIKATKEQWNKIHKDYKGSMNGKRTVLSGCISDKIGSLMIEGIHFEIV